MQSWFEDRLIYSTSWQIMLSFSEVFMGREPLRIPVSVLWSRTNLSSFYQNFGGPNIPVASTKYQNLDQPGRHVVNVSINREAFSRKTQFFKHIFVCFTFSTDNLYKVTLSRFRFPWCRCKFHSIARLGSKLVSIRSSPLILLIKSKLYCVHLPPLRNSVIFFDVSSCIYWNWAP